MNTYCRSRLGGQLCDPISQRMLALKPKECDLAVKKKFPIRYLGSIDLDPGSCHSGVKARKNVPFQTTITSQLLYPPFADI